jgi:hypothetical protein
MRKVFKKKSAPLMVAYGLKPDEVCSIIYHVDSVVVVNAGWITLTFGWDGRGREVVFAMTGADTFLLSAALPGLTAPLEFTGCADWVHVIDGLPDDFASESSPQKCVDYCGFRIEYGEDFDDRDYLYIGMPNGELNLLFRKPTPPFTAVWSERRAVALDHAMVVGPMDSARTMVCDWGDSLDAELAAILGESD